MQIEIENNRSIPVLSVCTCCLAESSPLRKYELEVGPPKGNVQRYITLALPWCGRCWNRRRAFKAINWVCGAGALLAAILVGDMISDSEYGGWAALIGAVVFGFAAYAASLYLVQALPFFRIPGHAVGCDAITGASEFKRLEESGVRQGCTVYFANDSFAKLLLSRLRTGLG